jgi:hypothetical protein
MAVHQPVMHTAHQSAAYIRRGSNIQGVQETGGNYRTSSTATLVLEAVNNAVHAGGPGRLRMSYIFSTGDSDASG